MKKYWFYIFSTLLLFVTIAIQAMEKNPHEFKQSECILCHQVGALGNILGTGEQLTPLCESCHPDLFTNGYMHPVDIRPRTVTIPLDMPLSSDGMLTCNTCHDVHTSPVTPLGTPSSFLRRIESGRVFCISCHGTDLEDAGHRAILGEAHFQSEYIVTDPFADCDPTSINCISCHDGSIGGSVTVNTGVWIHQQSYFGDGHEKGGHPICFDYETAQRKTGRKTDLQPRPMVDMRLTFYNGKMGCGTCHNPYHDEENYLVMENRASQLCLSCHLVDE